MMKVGETEYMDLGPLPPSQIRGTDEWFQAQSWRWLWPGFTIMGQWRKYRDGKTVATYGKTRIILRSRSGEDWER